LLLSIALSRLAQVASVWTQITAAPYSFAAKPNLSNWRLSQKAIHPKTACPTHTAALLLDRQDVIARGIALRPDLNEVTLVGFDGE
jgi:hypothetical protein